MEKRKLNKWVIISYACLLVSIVSTFTTVVAYTNAGGIRKTFSIIDFISSDEFDSFVLYEYTGTVVCNINAPVIRGVVVIGVLALLCAAIGIATLSKQRKNLWPFVLTLIGLIGTMIPSIMIFVAVILSKHHFTGSMSCGIYPVATPVAMIVCIITATEMHRRNQEYIKRLEDAKGLIFRGGDLK